MKKEDIYQFLGKLTFEVVEKSQTNERLVEIQKILIKKQKEQIKTLENEIIIYKKKDSQMFELAREIGSEKTRVEILQKQNAELKRERDDLNGRLKAIQQHLDNQAEQRKKLRSSYNQINSCVLQHEHLRENDDVKYALEILQDSIKN